MHHSETNKLQAGDSRSTRERLLKAATEVFTEQGFHQATVRDICRRAKANVASVNYHFHSKEDLYVEVVQALYQQTELVRHHTMDEERSPIDRLRAYLRDHFRILTEQGGEGGRFAAIMTQEMSDPSPVFEQLLETCLQPRGKTLEAILQALAGGSLTPFQLRACTMSVLGQVIVYHKTHKVLGKVDPGFLDNPQLEERLVDHIVTFSEAGLRAILAAGEGNAI